MIKRELNLLKLLTKKSHFLFGPRQTGKTSLIRTQLPDLTNINLLESDKFAEYSAKPSLLRERVESGSKVVIDEIQKLPQLLDEVQWLIEERGVTFLLTGSSTRKLHRGGTNLLGGRARSRALLPLTSNELGEEFDLDKAINRGLLPSIYFSDEPDEDLQAYVGDYLTQEIAAEAFVRNITSYSRFLEVVGYFNASQVNFERLASDAQISPSTVRNYFQILQDTLLGTVLLPWKEKGKAREVSTPKVYLFDTGVARRLQGRRELVHRTPEFGQAFEAFIHHELRAYIEYRGRDSSIRFWRTHSGSEVDFVINDEIGIEVKFSRTISQSDLKGLYAISDNYKMKKLFLISDESTSRVVGNVTILPWRLFLSKLWADEIFS